jgi:transglutaminase-like putative cysteine protease
MPTLTIRHVTHYRYRRPVAFGEHRMMLRPRDSHDQRVIEASLAISPKPASLRFVEDAFGNHVGIARFSDSAKELRFESVVRLALSDADGGLLASEADQTTYPFAYGADEMPDLARFIECHCPDPDKEVHDWARQFVPAHDVVGIVELLTRLCQGIYHGFAYRRREAKGIQQPLETLRIGHGSCRDFAMLMIEAARSLGFAARFASGYLGIPLDFSKEPVNCSARGSTHAWVQIYVPGTGWTDFDPTSGNVGKCGLVPVAVVRDPRHATPLHGTFIGRRSDNLGMQVQVSVTSDTPQAMSGTAEISPARVVQLC